MNEMTSTESQVADFQNDLEELRGSFKQLATATDRCVHNYAWASVGLAALLGMCVGLLMGGPRSRE
jgi:ElaB/YqjD/DUF883 family membrane-anchored ribosome-binding protein